MKRINVIFCSCLLILTQNQTLASAGSDMLWSTQTGYVGARVNSGVDPRSIPDYARLHDLSFEVPKINPDILIVGIRFDKQFDGAPLSATKKMSVGLRIFAPTPNCVYDDKCTKYVYLEAPDRWVAPYPTAPGTATVDVYDVGIGDSDKKYENMKCPAPWWIDNSDWKNGVIKFQLSTTCLELPQGISAYAFAATDIGLTPTPYNFTGTASVDNPYWQLAAAAYTANGGKAKVGKPYYETYQPKENPKTKIVCKKGSKTKSVIGTNPKCPKGYKIKK